MIGIVIKIDDEDLDSDGIVWTQIMWADGKITWEDIHTTLEDPLFYILNTDAYLIVTGKQSRHCLSLHRQF